MAQRDNATEPYLPVVAGAEEVTDPDRVRDLGCVQCGSPQSDTGGLVGSQPSVTRKPTGLLAIAEWSRGAELPYAF